jgi:hypothetical protein
LRAACIRLGPLEVYDKTALPIAETLMIEHGICAAKVCG